MLVRISLRWPIDIIMHQTHYEKSDWSRAFNQFTIACELDMINAISAADIAFIMSSSTSAWLLSPLECSPQKQNGWTLRFCFWGWIMSKMYNKTINWIRFSHDIMNYYSTNCNTIQIWSWCSRFLSSVGNGYPAVYVASYVGRKSEVKKCRQKDLKMLRVLLSVCWIIKQLSWSISRNIVWF